MTIRMRRTSSQTRSRRSHHALSPATIITDTQSGNMRLPHRLDETTGKYRNKLIKAPRVKKERTKAEKYSHPGHTTEHAKRNARADEQNLKLKKQDTHDDGVSIPLTRRGA